MPQVHARIRFEPPRVPDQEDDLETGDDDEETEAEETEEVKEDDNVRCDDDQGLGPINVLAPPPPHPPGCGRPSCPCRGMHSLVLLDPCAPSFSQRLRLVVTVAATTCSATGGRPSIEPPRTGGPGAVLPISFPVRVSPSPLFFFFVLGRCLR